MGKQEMIKLYEEMVLTRKYLEKIESEILKGKLKGFYHLSTGQESVSIGIINAINETDYILPTHRQQGVLINKLDINKFTAELLGRVTGYCQGKGFEFHVSSKEDKLLPMSAVLGSGGPISVGVAMALKLDKRDGVVISCCGDGASSEGNIHEAMNIASIFNLPVVFVIENNGWGISTPLTRQANVQDLSARATGYGMEGITIDGTDVVTVKEAMEAAIEKARKGQPNVVEMKVVRHRGHFEGDAQVYRSKEELERARSIDCIKKHEENLKAEGWLTSGDIERIGKKCFERVEAAFEYAENSPLPTREQTLDMNQVYVL